MAEDTLSSNLRDSSKEIIEATRLYFRSHAPMANLVRVKKEARSGFIEHLRKVMAEEDESQRTQDLKRAIKNWKKDWS